MSTLEANRCSMDHRRSDCVAHGGHQRRSARPIRGWVLLRIARLAQKSHELKATLRRRASFNGGHVGQVLLGQVILDR